MTIHRKILLLFQRMITILWPPFWPEFIWVDAKVHEGGSGSSLRFFLPYSYRTTLRRVQERTLRDNPVSEIKTIPPMISTTTYSRGNAASGTASPRRVEFSTLIPLMANFCSKLWWEMRGICGARWRRLRTKLSSPLVIMNHVGNGTEEDKARIAFALIHHSRLTPSAFQAFKSKRPAPYESKLSVNLELPCWSEVTRRNGIIGRNSKICMKSNTRRSRKPRTWAAHPTPHHAKYSPPLGARSDPSFVRNWVCLKDCWSIEVAGLRRVWIERSLLKFIMSILCRRC